MKEIDYAIYWVFTHYKLTVLLVEQKLPFARRVGERFCIIEKGRSVATGDMPDLDDKLISQYLTV